MEDQFDLKSKPRKATAFSDDNHKIQTNDEIQRYNIQMFKQGILRFLTKSQFLQFIKNVVDGELYEEFQPIFLIESSQFENTFGKQQSLEYRFPIVQVKSDVFLKAKISLFIAEYMTQYKQIVTEKLDQENFNDFYDMQIPLILEGQAKEDENQNNINQDSHNRPQVEDSNEEYATSYQQIQMNETAQLVRNQQNDIVGQEAIKQTAVQEQNNEDKVVKDKKSVVLQKEQNIVVGKFYKFPPFLSIKFKSFSTLISYDVTNIHQRALDEVRELIMKQLRQDKKDGLLQNYENFMKQYLIFRIIKHHQWEDQLNTDQILKNCNFNLKYYLQQRIGLNLQQLKESQLLKSWKYIFSKLPNLLQQKLNKVYNKQLRTQICQHLQSGLYRISLIRSNNHQLYGVTQKNYIMINVNRCRPQEEQEFRTETIKAYLYICIVHELTHFLLRQFKNYEIKQYTRSFSSSDQASFGERFIQQFLLRSNSFPPFFKIKQRAINKSFVDSQNIGSRFETKTSQFQKNLISLKKKGVFNEQYIYIKNYLGGYNQLYKMLDIVNFKEKDQLQKRWNEIYLYIQKTLSNDDNFVDDLSQSSKLQNVYRIFFMIFLTEEIAFKIFPFLLNQQKQYYQYKNLVHNSQIKKYYIEQNGLIKLIVQLLGNQLIRINTQNAENVSSNQYFVNCIYSRHILYYQKSILNDKLTPEKLKLKIEQYRKQLDQQSVSIIYDLNVFSQWKENTDRIIQPFDLSQFIKEQIDKQKYHLTTCLSVPKQINNQYIQIKSDSNYFIWYFIRNKIVSKDQFYLIIYQFLSCTGSIAKNFHLYCKFYNYN